MIYFSDFSGYLIYCTCKKVTHKLLSCEYNFEGGQMSQFYYREDELRKLNKRYAGDKGETNRFMERQVLGQKSPLYGRRTGQFKIEPLDYIVRKETPIRKGQALPLFLSRISCSYLLKNFPIKI